MKRLIALAIVLVSLFAFGQSNRDVTFTWDPPSAQDLPSIKSIRLYTLTGTTYAQIGEAQCSGTPNACPETITVSIAVPGTYQFVARFWDGLQESGDSNIVISPVGPPGHLRK